MIFYCNTSFYPNISEQHRTINECIQHGNLHIRKILEDNEGSFYEVMYSFNKHRKYTIFSVDKGALFNDSNQFDEIVFRDSNTIYDRLNNVIKEAAEY